MASPDPKRQTKPALARQITQPAAPEIIVKNLVAELNQLKPVNFILTTPNNPYSLPASFGQILHQEQLLNPFGKVVTENLHQLNRQIFLQRLTVKLTFSLIKSQFLQQIFSITESAAKLVYLPKDFLLHFNAFGRLFSEYYSIQPAGLYLELHYPHLFTSKPTLNHYPVDLALTQSHKALKEVLAADKEKLMRNLQAFLEAADTNTKNLVDLNQKIIDQILNITDSSPLEINDFNILINKDVFPQIAVQYPLAGKN